VHKHVTHILFLFDIRGHASNYSDMSWNLTHCAAC